MNFTEYPRFLMPANRRQQRTALVAALVFLYIKGVSLERDDERMYELTMAAAEGRPDKEQLADQLRKLPAEAQA